MSSDIFFKFKAGKWSKSHHLDNIKVFLLPLATASFTTVAPPAPPLPPISSSPPSSVVSFSSETQTILRYHSPEESSPYTSNNAKRQTDDMGGWVVFEKVFFDVIW